MNWDFLDKDCEIWCINVRNNYISYVSIIKQLKKINILNKVKFLHPDKFNNNLLSKGNWGSHKYCLQMALNSNKNALIIESDIIFDDRIKSYYDILKKYYMERNWDIIRLGSVVFNYNTKINNNLWKGEFLILQSYFINKEFIHRCIDDIAFNSETSVLKNINEYYITNSNKDLCFIPNLVYLNKYMINQKILNLISWHLRYLPNVMKYINPYVLLFKLNNFASNILIKYKFKI